MAHVKQVTQLGDWNTVARLCSTTVNKVRLLDKEPSRQFIVNMLKAEHSPIRAVSFLIELEGIPSFVSTHLVRHKTGIEHFVSTRREDRFEQQTVADRNTPVDHTILANCQALITISRKRLCSKASDETQQVWRSIKKAVPSVVAQVMVPECIYRGHCSEIDGCGYDQSDLFKKELQDYRD